MRYLYAESACSVVAKVFTNLSFLIKESSAAASLYSEMYDRAATISGCDGPILILSVMDGDCGVFIICGGLVNVCIAWWFLLKKE